MIASLLASSVAAAQSAPEPHPNSQRYAERNPSAATGRSGTATLAARALRSRDGSTLLEVTTGALDSTATPPGYLSKVQVKTFDAAGQEAWTKDYNNLSGTGYRSYVFTNLNRGEPLQVQANIRGINGKRTDVVTVTGNVKMRPDLAVTNIDAPVKVPVGTQVNVAATIAEVNGDAGAAGNCVLELDGTEIDRAQGVWVDAGGVVSCAFSFAADTVGTKTLRVSITGAVPADDNAANDSATATLEVQSLSASEPLTYNAYAENTHTVYSGRWVGWYRNDYSTGDGYGGDWSYEQHQETDNETAGMWIRSNTPVTFPVDVSYTGVADGATVQSASHTGLLPDYTSGDCTSGYSDTVAQRFDAASNSYIYVRYWCDPWQSFTEASAQRYAGNVVYLAHGYTQYWNRYGGNTYYYYNNLSDSTYAYGTPWAMTTSFSGDLQITDADGKTFAATADVQLSPYSYDYSQPGESCWNYSYSTGYESYTAHQCQYDYRYTMTGLTGSVYGAVP